MAKEESTSPARIVPSDRSAANDGSKGKDASSVPDSGPATLLMATFGVHVGSPSMTDKEGCLPDEYSKCKFIADLTAC
jgi:hypothetical protein